MILQGFSSPTHYLNQIARRVNSGGDIYGNDFIEVNEQLKAIRLDFGRLLAQLTELTTAKPGKRFIKPPTIRDLPEYAERQSVAGGE